MNIYFVETKKDESPMVDFYGNDHKVPWPPKRHSLLETEGYTDTLNIPTDTNCGLEAGW